MHGKILLDFGEPTYTVEQEEKTRFLRSILEQCFQTTEVVKQIQDIWGMTEGTLSPTQKIQLRTILTQYGVVVRDDNDGKLEIFLERELIGSWKKPKYVLKKEPHALNPRKRFYLEMSVNCWSLFDQQDEATQGDHEP